MMILCRRGWRLTTCAMARRSRTTSSDVIGSTLAVPRIPSVPNNRCRSSAGLFPICLPFLAQDPQLHVARLLLHQLDVGRELHCRCHFVDPRLAAGRVDINRTVIQLKRLGRRAPAAHGQLYRPPRPHSVVYAPLPPPTSTFTVRIRSGSPSRTWACTKPALYDTYSRGASRARSLSINPGPASARSIGAVAAALSCSTWSAGPTT